MTKDYSGCEFYIPKWQDKFVILSKVCRLGIYQESWTTDNRISKCCENNTNCHYKQWKKDEHQLKLVNQDNDALSRYCEMLEQKISQLGNMQV